MWNPWKTHWALALVKGITRGKGKSSFDLGGNRTYDLRSRSTVTLLTEPRGQTERVGDDWGGQNRKLTLKCKLKCYVKPMKDPLGVSPNNGNQGTPQGKEKILCSAICFHSATRHNIHMYPRYSKVNTNKSSPHLHFKICSITSRHYQT